MYLNYEKKIGMGNQWCPSVWEHRQFTKWHRLK